jgi:hypothetical protein
MCFSPCTIAVKAIKTMSEKHAHTWLIWRNAFLQLALVFNKCASSTAMTYTWAVNMLSSLDRSLNPGEVSCSGARNTMLGSILAVFHISSLKVVQHGLYQS